MIRIIFNKYDSLRKSGVNSLKSLLASWDLSEFDQNVTEMLDSMQLAHSQIIHRGGKDDDFMLKVFNALKTSTNDSFLTFANKENKTWAEDKVADGVDVLIEACAKKHNNIAQDDSSQPKGKKSKQEFG